MKKGLILEGGAMRGLFTAGVLDVMMEAGLAFDGMIGVSAGAAFGCNYKSRQIGRTLRYNKKYCKDPLYCGLRSLLKTGDIYGAEFGYRTLPTELDVFDIKAFDASPMEFYVGATDVETGEPIYRRCPTAEGTELLDWIRASASMPFVSRVVEIDGKKLLDGGISDSIPLAYFEQLGYDRNVVVLTQPAGFVKRPVRGKPFVKLALRHYPKAAEAMLGRHVFYNETLTSIAEKEAAGEIFVIRPDKTLPIGHITHSPERLEEVYRLGRTVAERHLAALQSFLSHA